MSCSLHGECVLTKKAEVIARLCDDCGDYERDETVPPPPLMSVIQNK